jgi:excisionase family DNA binding protein
MKLLLAEKPVVIEDDLSPAEAGEIAKVSKPMMLHYLKTGKINGYLVGTHWRVKRDSLLKFIDDRESFSKAMSDMDKAGFGLD